MNPGFDSNSPHETINDLRADIPALREATYLNYGSHGPSPRRVVESASAILEHLEYGTASIDRTEEAMNTYRRIRSRIADVIGAGTDEVAFTQSTTDGINRIANAFDWNAGDVVVRTDLEHQAGTLPWKHLERKGVEVRVVATRDGQIDTEAFADAVRDAKLACFSAITWTHGTRLPVEELADIASEAGTFTLVDAVQVPGQQPMDVQEWGVDAVAAAGHKWMLSPQGSGFLYLRSDCGNDLVPESIGPRGIESSSTSTIEYKEAARRFEVGSASLAPHVGLGEAIDILTEIGLDAVHKRIKKRIRQLKAGVASERLLSPSEFHSGLVTIDVDEPSAVADELSNQDIVIRSLAEPQAVRISVHATSTKEEIDEVIAALDQH